MAHSPKRSPLQLDTDALLPAAAYLRSDPRRDGWTAGRQAAFLTHLADNGVVADAARSVGMSLAGAYALRRKAAGYAFNLGWEAALLIARRIVADQLLTAAIKGEEARWVREEGVTTYTRHNPKLALTLLDRVTPVESLSEVLAVVARFDWFMQLIDDRASPADLWQLFFDSALPQRDIEARDRVRAGLLLADESADFEGEDASDLDEGEGLEYKSLDGIDWSLGKHTKAGCAPPEIPAPARAIVPSIVALNSFQGPSGRNSRSSRIAANREAFSRNAHSESAEGWTLKRVQGDEQRERIRERLNATGSPVSRYGPSPELHPELGLT